MQLGVGFPAARHFATIVAAVADMLPPQWRPCRTTWAPLLIWQNIVMSRTIMSPPGDPPMRLPSRLQSEESQVATHAGTLSMRDEGQSCFAAIELCGSPSQGANNFGTAQEGAQVPWGPQCGKRSSVAVPRDSRLCQPSPILGSETATRWQTEKQACFEMEASLLMEASFQRVTKQRWPGVPTRRRPPLALSTDYRA